MRSDEMLNELEANFGLKDNHIKILKELSLSGSLEADKLAKNTGVPLGRIYEFLNDLVEAKLVLKTATFPSIYSIDSLENRITEFMRYQSDSLIQKEKKITSLFETTDTQYVEHLTDKDRYSLEDLKIIKNSNRINTLGRHILPHILYPLDEKEFFKLRNFVSTRRKTILAPNVSTTRLILFRTVKEEYNQGREFNYIIDKDTLKENLVLFKKYYGKKYPEFIKLIISQLNSHPKVKIYVTNLSLPMFIRIGQNEVLLGLSYFGSTTGLLIRGKQTVSFYNKHFDEILENSVSIKEFLK